MRMKHPDMCVVQGGLWERTHVRPELSSSLELLSKNVCKHLRDAHRGCSSCLVGHSGSTESSSHSLTCIAMWLQCEVFVEAGAGNRAPRDMQALCE
ncbi:hypothetical protein AB1Y20_006494 [Prymnesium parvum]|uniref:Uncharacterized protein n=1 Tax=Prymnesium parvum TaxID=97485 RepID=A0AB34IXW9_PRYPA|mmetsp:Transcript_2616/g.5500  ORF Transcript_2616/g.5500 Transcript_2616/m.5500 type:complete len:96 (+) Transcript_2616:406-693(+)